jgi:hypothetical protein
MFTWPSKFSNATGAIAADLEAEARASRDTRSRRLTTHQQDKQRSEIRRTSFRCQVALPQPTGSRRSGFRERRNSRGTRNARAGLLALNQRIVGAITILGRAQLKIPPHGAWTLCHGPHRTPSHPRLDRLVSGHC